MKTTLFLILLFIFNTSFSQSIVSVKITNPNIMGKAYLLHKDISENKTLIDTSTIINNQVRLSIPDSLNNNILILGFFTPYSEKPIEIPLISSNEKLIALQVSFPEVLASCIVNSSNINKTHFDFIHKDIIFQEKKQLFNRMLELYKDNTNTEFYKALQKEKNNFEQEVQQFYKQYFISNSNITNLIKHQIEIESNNYSQLSANNEELFLNSYLVMQWVWTYISNNATNNPNHTAQIENYKNSVDSLSSYLSFYPKEQIVIMKIIADEMEKAGFDDVSLYIFNNIISQYTCEPDEEIIVKSECLEKIQIGKPAPNIILNKKDIGIASLNKIKANYTLIVFWASWCSHCQNLLPKLNNFYNSKANSYDLKILAISIDEDKKSWTNFIDNNNLQWYNYCDFDGWNSLPASQYCLRSTPSMFLLDKNKKIIAKPQSVTELEMILDK